jgi:hypothetical protein
MNDGKSSYLLVHDKRSTIESYHCDHPSSSDLLIYDRICLFYLASYVIARSLVDLGQDFVDDIQIYDS